MNHPRTYRFFKLLGMIAVAAVALRLASSFELLHHYAPVTQPSSDTDMFTYRLAARQIVDGEYDYSRGFYYQPFYYAVFLPAVFRTIGDSPQAVILAQSLLGVMTVWLTGITYALIFGRAAGLIAAGLIAGHGLLIFYTAFPLIATLQTFWMALLCYLVIRGMRLREGPKWWALVGLVHAAAMLTRGNALILIPAVVAALIWSTATSRRSQLTSLVTYLLCAALPQLPFAVVNDHSSYGIFAPSTAGPAVLALGNTPESPPGGRDPEAGAGPMEYPESCREWTRQAYDRGPGHVPISASILRWIRQEPLAYLELKFRMFLLFWNAAEIPNNVALSTFGTRIPVHVVHLPFLVGFLCIGALGLYGAGLACLKFRHRTVQFIVVVVSLYCIATIAFYMLARFRLPVVPALCGLSGYALSFTGRKALRTIRGRCAPRRLLPLLLSMAACFLFVGWGYDLYRFNWERPMMRFVRPDGVVVALKDKTILKDHGPATFGGWLPEEVLGNAQITKHFTVPADEHKPGRWLVRFPVLTAVAQTLIVQVQPSASGATFGGTPHAIPRGLTWVEIELGELDLNLSAPLMSVHLGLRPSSAGVRLFFDAQRWYGRTLLNGNASEERGEMVIELVRLNAD